MLNGEQLRGVGPQQESPECETARTNNLRMRLGAASWSRQGLGNTLPIYCFGAVRQSLFINVG